MQKNRKVLLRARISYGNSVRPPVCPSVIKHFERVPKFQLMELLEPIGDRNLDR